MFFAYEINLPVFPIYVSAGHNEEQINRSIDLKQVFFTTFSKPTAAGVHVMKTQMLPKTHFPINTYCNDRTYSYCCLNTMAKKKIRHTRIHEYSQLPLWLRRLTNEDI